VLTLLPGNGNVPQAPGPKSIHADVPDTVSRSYRNEHLSSLSAIDPGERDEPRRSRTRVNVPRGEDALFQIEPMSVCSCPNHQRKATAVAGMPAADERDPVSSRIAVDVADEHFWSCAPIRLGVGEWRPGEGEKACCGTSNGAAAEERAG
jgi:hypothetical protein